MGAGLAVFHRPAVRVHHGRVSIGGGAHHALYGILPEAYLYVFQEQHGVVCHDTLRNGAHCRGRQQAVNHDERAPVRHGVSHGEATCNKQIDMSYHAAAAQLPKHIAYRHVVAARQEAVYCTSHFLD